MDDRLVLVTLTFAFFSFIVDCKYRVRLFSSSPRLAFTYCMYKQLEQTNDIDDDADE